MASSGCLYGFPLCVSLCVFLSDLFVREIDLNWEDDLTFLKTTAASRTSFQEVAHYVQQTHKSPSGGEITWLGSPRPKDSFADKDGYFVHFLLRNLQNFYKNVLALF